ncbi:hypothetical protein GCM10020220_092030 [Nonomuraea rubra]|uniref:hypothetical protein n=1 Tax=Nonomuraea rubra TaxID=46180 RepID=UPI0031EFDDE0
MLRRTLGVLATAGALLLTAVPASATAVEPLPRAHAHNDYEHERPLLDALDHGFTSVEADIYLVDGELRVGHDPEDLRPGRTLQSLYLDPLAQRVRHGSVYPRSRQQLQLLVDIKNKQPRPAPATILANHRGGQGCYDVQGHVTVIEPHHLTTRLPFPISIGSKPGASTPRSSNR